MLRVIGLGRSGCFKVCRKKNCGKILGNFPNFNLTSMQSQIHVSIRSRSEHPSSPRRIRNVNLPKAVKDIYYEHLFVTEKLLTKEGIKLRPIDVSKLFVASKDTEIDHCRELSDNELIQQISSAKSQKELSDIETKLCSRSVALNRGNLFLASAAFYEADYPAALFNRRFLSITLSRFEARDLSKAELMKLLFVVMLLGDAPEQLMLKLETELENAKFTTKEVSLICMAFFLANRRLKSQTLLENITEHFRGNVESYSIVEINNVLKAFRHANHVSPSLCELLGDHIISMKDAAENERFFINVMELCRYYASVRYHHVNFTLEILERLSNVTRTMKLRSKDYAQLLMCLAQFNMKPSAECLNQCEKQLERFREEGQYEVYPEALVTSIHALIMLEFYPQRLIKLVLSSSQLRRLKALPHVDKAHQLLVIYISVLVERPEMGVQLPRWFVDTFPARVLGETRHELNTRTGLDRVMAALGRVYGDDMVQCTNILPCFQTASLEVHVDSANQAVRFSRPEGRTLRERLTGLPDSVAVEEEGGREVVSGDVFDALLGTCAVETTSQSSRPKTFRKLSVEVLGWHQCCINTGEPQGLALLKYRLLTGIGYSVIVIPPADAKRFLEISDDDVIDDVKRRTRDVMLNVSDSDSTELEHLDR